MSQIIYFWISPSIHPKQELTIAMKKIFPSLSKTEELKPKSTLSILSPDEIENSKTCSITLNCLNELLTKSPIQNIFQEIYPNYSSQFPFSNKDKFISFCLINLKVKFVCPHLPSNEAKILLNHLKLLGGSAVLDIHEADVIISTTSASETVFAAANMELPILSVRWLETAFNTLEKPPFDEYILPPFLGCSFTSTDITPALNKQFSDKIKKGGGTWSSQLSDKTTYLISSKISTSAKSQLALKIGVIFVKPEWIQDCHDIYLSPIDYILNWWNFSKEKRTFFSGKTFLIDETIPLFSELSEAINMANGTILNLNNFSNFQTLPRPDYIVTNDAINQNSSFNQIINTLKTLNKNPNISNNSKTNNNLNHNNHNNNKNNNNNNNESVIVSPTYVWHCLSACQILKVSDSLLYKPFLFSLPRFSDKSVAIINFSNETRAELCEILRRIGVPMTFTVKDSTSIIISPDTSFMDSFPEKIKVPVVRSMWCIELAQTGEWPDPKNFAPPPSEFQANIQALVQAIKAIPQNHQDIQHVTQMIDFSQSQKVPSSDRGKNQDDIIYDAEVLTSSLGKSSQADDPFLAMLLEE